MTEPVPTPVTDLHPVMLLPLRDVLDAGATTTAYSDPIAFLLLSGFLLMLTASFAFVLPVVTAPNAIVFGSGYPPIPEMAKVGAAVSVTGTAVIVGGVVWWLPFVWG